MTAHIDQLTEWWREAEKPVYVDPGDLMIQRHEPNDYSVTSSTVRFKPADDSIRILARAPKPKPAWHDAVAVIAHTDDGHIRQVWERDGDTGYWLGTERSLVRADKLCDVTPLIEAKVTDEAVERVLDVLHAWNDTYPAGLGTKLAAAALGIEAE